MLPNSQHSYRLSVSNPYWRQVFRAFVKDIRPQVFYWDDIMRAGRHHAMQKGEVTMMVLADYSKAFDTVKFKAILTKVNKMGFSSKFLIWMPNYLSDRYCFVQIDDRSSKLARVQFGVPQGSILGLVIFNLYLADLQNHLQCPCYQYTDNTTLFLHIKAKSGFATEMNKVISRLGSYSVDSKLALNESKTKCVLISTRQM